MITKEQLHEFNSEYITRYAKILSKGKRKEEMQHNHWRELSAFETGIKCFHLGEEYKSEDGNYILKIKGMIEEHSFSATVNGKRVSLEIFHDNESEYLVYHTFDKKIQFRPMKNER